MPSADTRVSRRVRFRCARHLQRPRLPPSAARADRYRVAGGRCGSASSLGSPACTEQDGWVAHVAGSHQRHPALEQREARDQPHA